MVSIGRRFHIRMAARLVGLHETTLRRYEKEGLVLPQRDDIGHRVYTEEDLRKIRSIALERASI
jgi:MerR family transcriptional regulator, heat shock protein HspR